MIISNLYSLFKNFSSKRLHNVFHLTLRLVGCLLESWPNYFLDISRSYPHQLFCDGSCLGIDSNFFFQPQIKPRLSSGYSTLLRIETIQKFKLLLLWFSDKNLLQHILKIRWWKQQNLLLTNLDHLECSQVPRILFKASRRFFLF